MRILPVLLCAGLLAGCGPSNDTDRYLDTGTSTIAGTSGRLTLGVNTYLWRATLDTLSTLPLVSADPFGGVIITDWYTPQQTPNERLKVTVYILDRALRADGLRVSVFRQIHDDKGWTDTVLVLPGETVRVQVTFSRFPGLYLYHCHILEHEDLGMMRNFRIR